MRDDVYSLHRRACQRSQGAVKADKQRQAPLLHTHMQGTTQHHNVSKRAVHRGAQVALPGDDASEPGSENSAGGGGEAAAEEAEESASSDCASEVAGEVGSSTAVSRGVDMMCCVQGTSERRREKGRR